MEEPPSFPGGEPALYRYLSKHTRYPAKARNQGIEGVVYVTFVVDKEGPLRDVRILKSVHTLLDKECLRVVRGMPAWVPGKQRGKAVHTQYNLPIRFTIPEDEPLPPKRKG